MMNSVAITIAKNQQAATVPSLLYSNPSTSVCYSPTMNGSDWTPFPFEILTASCAYKCTGGLSVSVTGEPAIFTQIVSGSEPIFSVVKLDVLVTDPGTVTGMVVEHWLLVVVSVMAVMTFATGSMVYAS